MVSERDGIATAYLSWLCKCVGLDEEHQKLGIKLQQTRFVWLNERDKNRAHDGIDLRNKFAEETGYDISSNALNEACSVLEMLVALAIRCESDIMGDPDQDDRTALWFDMMLENLGLKNQTDKKFDASKVDDILEKWMTLKYKRNGIGSPFPNAFGAETDQRNVEIWFQLQGYLGEKYSF